MDSQFRSETLGAIFKALADAQREIQNPVKNARNPHFKNTYTTLDEGLNVVREALSAVGICVFQRTYLTDNILMLETVLGHTSGEWLSSQYPVISVPYKPQDGLSALTYARRGALFAAVGIAGEDDDGNAANKATTIEPKNNKKIEDESILLLSKMEESLNTCQTVADCEKWRDDNVKDKQKLTILDQAKITRLFKEMQAKIKEKEQSNG